MKIRQGLSETSTLVSPEQISMVEGVIKSEMPNNSLYTFEGTLRLRGKEVPLNPEQLLLRGAMLRNTRWVYGIVVFTGHETKLMKNSTWVFCSSPDFLSYMYTGVMLTITLGKHLLSEHKSTTLSTIILFTSFLFSSPWLYCVLLVRLFVN